MRAPAILTVEQRFLHGPSLWSGTSCLVSLVDMGPLARALTTDVPGLDQLLLARFPEMRDCEDALRRGVFIAEALGRVALELQRTAGAAPAPHDLMTMHGKRSQVSIVVPGQRERLAVQAFALACAIVGALCNKTNNSPRNQIIIAKNQRLPLQSAA
jgi:cyanophycin synthetase